MCAQRVVKLGQEAFVLSREGEVVRTMVARLDEGSYQFLNGDSSGDPHWFSFEAAARAASACLSFREAAIRKGLRTLARKRRALTTKKYESAVRDAPYRAVDLRDTWAIRKRRRARERKTVRVPGTYLELGSVVYAIITPLILPKELVYRPYGHFILETEVKSIWFSPDGEVHYGFTTPFSPEEFFGSRKEAEARLRSYSEPGTLDPIYFVSSKKEKKELEKINEDDIPF
jgi:hypothetical protein